MPDITISITNIEQTVLRHIMPDPIEWLRNAIRNRARKAAHWCVTEYSDKNPAKLTDQELLDLLQTFDLPPHPGE